MTHKPRRVDLNFDAFIAGVAGKMTAAELGVYWLMCLLYYSHSGPFDYDERRFKSLLADENWKTFRAAFQKLLSIGKLRLLDPHGAPTEASLKGHCTATVDVLGCHSPLTEASLRLHCALTNGVKGGRPTNKNNGLEKPIGYSEHNPAENLLPIPIPVPIPKEESPSLRSGVSSKLDDPLSQAIEIYHTETASVGWPKVKKLTTNRRQRLKARLTDCGGLDGWRAALQRAVASDFLAGREGRSDGHDNWVPDLDFFLQQKSFVRLIEGKFDNHQQDNGHDKRTSNMLAGTYAAIRAVEADRH